MHTVHLHGHVHTPAVYVRPWSVYQNRSLRRKASHSRLCKRADSDFRVASVAADFDVAIVGGGPGGLASAAALFSAFGDGARVKVYRDQLM